MGPARIPLGSFGPHDSTGIWLAPKPSDVLRSAISIAQHKPCWLHQGRTPVLYWSQLLEVLILLCRLVRGQWCHPWPLGYPCLTNLGCMGIHQLAQLLAFRCAEDNAFAVLRMTARIWFQPKLDTAGGIVPGAKDLVEKGLQHLRAIQKNHTHASNLQLT